VDFCIYRLLSHDLLGTIHTHVILSYSKQGSRGIKLDSTDFLVFAGVWPKQGSRGIELDSNFFSVFLGPWPQSLGPSRTIGTG
jgi:hypothetical protein